eukprot:7675568-Lingulodinium_polyedra.AAC.1
MQSPRGLGGHCDGRVVHVGGVAAVEMGRQIGAREQAKAGGADGRPHEAETAHSVLQSREEPRGLEVEQKVP